MILADWAARWGIPLAAMAELENAVLRLYPEPQAGQAGASESAVSTRVRVEASRKGCRLWRNNVGAGYAEDGSFLRWGLANDSAQVNKVIKSADLIGIRPVKIEPAHVGLVIGQFISREMKAPGWRFTGTPREVAQLNWANIVNALGGNACFATGEGTL